MSQVAATLIAWREAQRRLEATEDPDEIPALTAEAARLHEAYRKAIAVEAQALNVKAHGEPSAKEREPKP